MELKQLMIIIRPEIEAALAEVARKHNIQKMSLGNGKYDPSTGNFHWKLDGIVNGGKNEIAARYEIHQEMLGLPPINTIIILGGKTHTITGLKRGGQSVLTICNGKCFRVPVDVVTALANKRRGK